MLLTAVMAVLQWPAGARKTAGNTPTIQISFASATASAAEVNVNLDRAEANTHEVAGFSGEAPAHSASFTASSVALPAGLTDYLPASALTERPVIVNDIDSELSERFSGIAAQSMTMILLINEYGDIDNVLFDDAIAAETLPLVLRADLVQRFLEARFLPGRLHGQPVRSQLRIAVSLHQ